MTLDLHGVWESYDSIYVYAYCKGGYEVSLGLAVIMVIELARAGLVSSI